MGCVLRYAECSLFRDKEMMLSVMMNTTNCRPREKEKNKTKQYSWQGFFNLVSSSSPHHPEGVYAGGLRRPTQRKPPKTNKGHLM